MFRLAGFMPLFRVEPSRDGGARDVRGTRVNVDPAADRATCRRSPPSSDCDRRPLTFGRGADADVVISDHVDVPSARPDRRGRGGWIVEDLGARNGTYVNGDARSMRRRRLVREGDVIQMGATVVRVASPRPPERPARSARPS